MHRLRFPSVRPLIYCLPILAWALGSQFLAPAAAQTTIAIRSGSFAAIAYSPSTRKVNYAFDCDSRAEAESLALKTNGEDDARIICWVSQGFAAIALGDDSSQWGYGYNYDDGANSADAKKTALDNCNARTKNAVIVLALSSDGQYKYDNRALDMAFWLTKKGERDKALEKVNDAIRQNPGNPNCYGLRADLYFAKQDYSKAIADYSQCILLDSSDVSAHFNRGLSYYTLNDLSNAEADFSQAIRLKPIVGKYYWARGKTYERRNDFSKALADYRKAVELSPDHIPTHQGLVVVYTDSADPTIRNFKLAQAHAEKACELSGWQDSLSLQMLALTYYKLGNIDEAIRVQTKAIELPNQSQTALDSARKQLDAYRGGKSSITPKPSFDNNALPSNTTPRNTTPSNNTPPSKGSSDKNSLDDDPPPGKQVPPSSGNSDKNRLDD